VLAASIIRAMSAEAQVILCYLNSDWGLIKTSALVMEAASTSETSVNFCETTRRYNSQDSHRNVFAALGPIFHVVCNLSKLPLQPIVPV
jgi:hypothetical protein